MTSQQPSAARGQTERSYPQTEALGVGDAAQDAAAAYQAQIESLIGQASGLGSLSQELASKADSLYKKFAHGDGAAAIQEALSTALAAGGAAACTAVGAGVVAPICALVGSQFGQAIGAAIWGNDSPGAVPPTETRAARFNQLFTALTKILPDDRASGAAKVDSVYYKAEAQIAVLCNLYVDGVVFGPLGTEDIDKDLVGTEDWQLGLATKVPAGGPDSMIAHFIDASALPHLSSPDLEYAWLKTTNPLAFASPTLPEFTDTSAGIEMRRHLWNFYSWPQKVQDGTDYETGLGKMFFARSVSRVLTVANVTNEMRFLGIVEAMAEATKAHYLPLCKGGDACVKGVLGEAWTGAYLVCLAARGIGSNPDKLAEASANTLDFVVAVNADFKRNNLATATWHPARSKTLSTAESKAAREGVSQDKKTAREGAGRVLLAAGVGLVLGVGGLGVARKAMGLPLKPTTWKPKGWLK